MALPSSAHSRHELTGMVDIFLIDILESAAQEF